jgi:hypothetical protein
MITYEDTIFEFGMLDHVNFRFVLGNDGLKLLRKELGISKKKMPPLYEGSAFTLMTNVEGKPYIIVAFDMSVASDQMSVLRTIIHECVHIVQFLCDIMCEQNPGIEFEAYATEYLFEVILKCYNNQAELLKGDKDGD